jgi:gluconate 2-dehydrogenase gamma chain
MFNPGQFSRRELMTRIAAGLTAVAAADAQHVHEQVAQEKTASKGPYKPKALTAHEYATVQRVGDLIIPADEHSPGALAAGAADFIDFLCNAADEMKDIWTGGVLWLDEAMKGRYQGKRFVEASPEQQTAMLDLIAWRKNRSPELNPGIEFFAFCRRLVADGYYTSPIGTKDVGFMGNAAVSSFSVPKEALDYAMKRSGLG